MLNRQTSSLIAAFIAAFSLFALSACQNKAENKTMDNTNQPTSTFADQPATGKFMDAPFTFVAGKASQHPFENSKFEFILYAETPKGDICDDFNFDLPHKSIIFATPKTTGAHPINNKDAVSFNNAEPNKNATVMVPNGNIEIVSINETTIVGKINTASADGKNTLNGNFTVNICK